MTYDDTEDTEPEEVMSNMAKANREFRKQTRQGIDQDRRDKARAAIERAQGNLKEAVK